MKRIIFFLTTGIIGMISTMADGQNEPVITTGKDVAVVQTEYGKVRGYIHNGIYVFKGIPYGKAKRFMPAEKLTPWKDVRSCMAYGPTCPNNQTPVFNDEIEFAFHRDRGYYNSEDCLNLNIWTKNISSGQKKPVMVWLHGGGFSSDLQLSFHLMMVKT